MFDSHVLNPQGKVIVANVKTKIADLMRAIDEDIPPGREKSIFQTKIEEAVFFAVKAIAMKNENHEEVKVF